MKILNTALVAAGLMALSACGGGDDNAANNAALDDTLNVAPTDFGNDTLLGNETLGNDTVTDTANVAAENEAADANASAGNSQ